MDRATPHPGRLSSTLAYYVAFVGLGLVLASMGPTLPSLAALTGATLSSLSAIFVARSTGYLGGVLFGGRLFDRVPGHPLMAAMLAAMAACMALVPTCTTLTALILVLFVLGLCEGTLDAGGNTLLIWLYPTGLGPWMNGLHFFFGVGALLSPLAVAAALGADGSVTGPYRLLGALLLPAILFVGWLPSPPIAAHASDGREALRTHRGTIVLVAGLLFAAVGAEVGFGNWVYTYALRRGLADEAGAALLTSTFWGAFTLGRLLGIPLAARFRPVAILCGCFVACAVGAAVVLWRPDLPRSLWTGTILGGLAVAPMFATVLALAGRRMPITGRITGWFFVGSSAGGMSVPWLIGQLFEPAGPASVFHVILLDLGIGLAVLAALLARTAGNRGAP